MAALARRVAVQSSGNVLRLIASPCVGLFVIVTQQWSSSVCCEKGLESGRSPVVVSRPNFNRILSDSDSFVGNQEFYRRLEGKLGSFIDSRTAQFFRVAPVPIRRIEGVVDQSDG